MLTTQTLSIKVTATDTSALSASETFTATVLSAPLVTAQTPTQTWQEGKPVSFTLPANTFTDPQGQKLSYSATLPNGQVLPSWLKLDAKTETFSGTAPGTAQSPTIKVTATDTSGLAGSETFAASVTTPTVPQTWTDGQTVDLVFPGKTFTDALGLKMTFVAHEISGPDVTSWLRFNPTTDEFTGKVPTNASDRLAGGGRIRRARRIGDGPVPRHLRGRLSACRLRCYGIARNRAKLRSIALGEHAGLPFVRMTATQQARAAIRSVW